MKAKLLLLVVIAVLCNGCADGYFVGVVTLPNPVTSEPLHGIMVGVYGNFEKGVKTENGANLP